MSDTRRTAVEPGKEIPSCMTRFFRSQCGQWATMFGLFALVVAILAGCSSNPSGPSATATQAAQATSGTTTTATPTVYIEIRGKIVNEAQKSVGSVRVDLLNSSRAVVAQTTSLLSGEYFFTNLPAGLYIASASRDGYERSDILIDAKSTAGVIVAGDITLVPSSPTGVPLVDLSGTLLSASNNDPLNTAQVSLDSGQSTITDLAGGFTLRNAASGTRSITISQPGMASRTLYIEVRDTDGNFNHADSVEFFGSVISVVASGTRWVANLGNIENLYTLHDSGILIGNISRYTLATDSSGVYYAAEPLVPAPGFAFDLWVQNPDQTWGVWRTDIRADANGTWKVDHIPPYSDNSYAWAAVATGSTVVTTAVGQTTAVNNAFTNNINTAFIGRSPVFGLGYRVYSGQTTVFNFTIPSFVFLPTAAGTTNPQSVSSSPTSLRLELAAAPGVLAAGPFALTDNLVLKWASVGTTTSYRISIQSAFAGSTATSTTIAVPTDGISTTVGASCTYSFNAVSAALGGFGRYVWRVGAVDPVTGAVFYSQSQSIDFRPSTSDLSPANNSVVSIPANRSNPAAATDTYAVNFVWPIDSQANQAIMELYDPAGLLVPRSSGVTPSQTLGGETAVWMRGTPAVGNYTWRVIYMYPDGTSLRSDFMTLGFQ